MASADLAVAADVDKQEGYASESGTQDQAIEISIDQLEQIDESLPRGLGALHGAPDGIVEATIAAYRFGTRMLLNSMGLLEEGEDETGRLRISERGKRLIAASADRYPQGDTDVDAALEAARNQLGHSGRARQLKVR
jgi:hypothetical protein